MADTVPDRPFELIETSPALSGYVARLARCPLVAVDMEANSLHAYTERVSLIQLTGCEEDGTCHHAVVDPLADVDVRLLAPVLADPKVVTVFHGSDYDVMSLKRDFDFAITNIYDTMIAARAVGMQRFGLADLVKGYFGVTLDKKYQKHDWSARPLSEEALQYAHLDTHYLPEIRQKLMAKVAEHGREDMVAEECLLIEQRDWPVREANPAAFMQMKGASKLSEEALKILRELHALREAWAKKRDWPPFKVMGGDLMLSIAKAAPKDARALEKVAGRKNRLIRRQGPALLDAVAAGLTSREALPRLKDKEKNGRRFTREDDALFKHLRAWRNSRAEQEGVEPSIVVNNQLLQEISISRPRTAEAVAKVPGIRQWQVRRYARALAEQVVAHEEGQP